MTCTHGRCLIAAWNVTKRGPLVFHDERVACMLCAERNRWGAWDPGLGGHVCPRCHYQRRTR